MVERTRVGVIGCGAISRVVHLPVLRRLPSTELVAVSDPDPFARAVAGRIAPGAALLDDPLDLLDRVDAVVVCAPTGVHAELGLAALRARKHLYLEKPLATTLEDGKLLAAAAADAGVVAAIGFNRRFHPAFRRARQAVASGRLGAVREVTTAFHEPIAASLPGWKRVRATGGGALLDLASHHVDLVRYLLCVEVELAGATVRSLASEHDEAELLLGLASGGTARIEVSFHRPHADVVTLSGDRLSVRADRRGGLRGRLRPRHDPSYRLALQAFVARVGGARVEVPDLTDGLRSLEVVVAAEEASS